MSLQNTLVSQNSKNQETIRSLIKSVMLKITKIQGNAQSKENIEWLKNIG